MHTKDKLAGELRMAGLPKMADKAATGYYDDYISPLDMPISQLVTDLARAGTPAAMDLRRRAMDGEFDATKEESDDWAKSPEGQEAFRSLWRGPRG